MALIQKFVLLLGHPDLRLDRDRLLDARGERCWQLSERRRVVAGDEHTSDARLICGRRVSGDPGLCVRAGCWSPRAAGWPLAAKVLLTTLSVAPAALLMGMPFPSGLRRLEKRHAPSVRWAWSLNAAASVLGSASAIFLAIYIGLRSTLLVGAALYVCALLVILATRDAHSKDHVPH